MDLTIDDARAVVADNVLWPRMRDFLWDFAPQIDASWLTDLAIGELRDAPRVKSWILRELSVEPCFHTFPKDDMSRVALLDGAVLLELVKWLGVLEYSAVLRRVTNGAQVRELKTALRGVYPDAFQYTAYFAKQGGSDIADSAVSSDAIIATGMGMLLAVLKDAPAPVVARMRMKLPKSLNSVAAGNAPSEGSFARLLKLKFREAYGLCC